MGLRSSGPLEVPREKKWGWVMWGGGGAPCICPGNSRERREEGGE